MNKNRDSYLYLDYDIRNLGGTLLPPFQRKHLDRLTGTTPTTPNISKLAPSPTEYRQVTARTTLQENTRKSEYYPGGETHASAPGGGGLPPSPLVNPMLPSSAIDYLPSLGVFTKTKKNVVDPCDQSDSTDGSPHDGQTPRG